MAKLKVYDRKNTYRLLGTLIVDREIRAAHLSVAVMPRMSVRHSCEPSSLVSTLYDKADFLVEWEYDTHDTSWHSRSRSEEMILLTDTPLETLMQIDKFMLPGESHGEMHVRHE